jgi:hypothetical protein
MHTNLRGRVVLEHLGAIHAAGWDAPRLRRALEHIRDSEAITAEERDVLRQAVAMENALLLLEVIQCGKLDRAAALRLVGELQDEARAENREVDAMEVLFLTMAIIEPFVPESAPSTSDPGEGSD